MLVLYLEYKVPYATTPQYYTFQLLCNRGFPPSKSPGVIDAQPVIPLIGLLQENQHVCFFYLFRIGSLILFLFNPLH